MLGTKYRILLISSTFKQLLSEVMACSISVFRFIKIQILFVLQFQDCISPHGGLRVCLRRQKSTSILSTLTSSVWSFKDKLEGYGRITLKRPNTMRGHYFWDLIVAKPVSIHHTFRYQMKDMFIIFQMIPHSLISTEWFGHSALPK